MTRDQSTPFGSLSTNRTTTFASVVGLSNARATDGGRGRYELETIISATVDGDITAADKTRLGNYQVNGTTAGANNQDTVWNGKITCSGNLFVHAYGKNTFNETIVTSGKFDTGDVASRCDPVFLNASNHFSYVRYYYNGLTFGAENAFGGGYVEHNRGKSSGQGVFKFNGFDQTLSYLDGSKVTEKDRIPDPTSSGTVCQSTRLATLTLTGGAANKSHWGYMKLGSNIRLVCDFTNPSYTQILTNRTHSTKGPIWVKRGNLKFDDSSSCPNLESVIVEAEGSLTVDTSVVSAFKAVTNLTVRGKLTVTDRSQVSFSAGEALLVDLGEGAELTLPAEETLNCRLCTNGVPLRARSYPSDDLPQLKSGKILAIGQQETDVWTGNGADRLAETPANWGANRSHDLESGSLDATFADGGDGAVFSGETVLRSMTLKPTAASADTDFTFAGATADATLKVLGPVTLNLPEGADVSHRWTFALPTEFVDSQEWNLPTNGVLVFERTAKLGNALSLSGEGGVSFLDGMVANNVQIRNTGVSVISGVVENPDGSIGGIPSSESAAGTFYARSHPVAQTELLVLSNAVIRKSFMYGGATSPVGPFGITCSAGTTNVIEGGASMSTPYTYLNVKEGAELRFEGGVKMSWSYSLRGGGTLRFCKEPFSIKSTSAKTTLSIYDGRGVFECPGNTCNILSVDKATGLADFRTDHVFLSTPLHFGDNAAKVVLNGTTQEFRYLLTYSSNVIESEAPATVVVTVGADPASSAIGATNVCCNVNGCVGFTMAGPGLLSFAGKAFQSSGDLAVTNGTMRFETTASWPNGTNVTVAGTGTLELKHGKALGKQTALQFADSGRLVIPEGVTQRVRTCTVDGEEMPAGTYTYETAPAALKAHLAEGGGSLAISGGLLLLVR